MEEKKMTTQDKLEQTVSALIVRIMPDVARMIESAVSSAVGKDREIILDYLDTLEQGRIGAAGEALNYHKGKLKDARENRRAQKRQP